MKKKNMKSLASIADAVAREGAALVPGGGLGYDLVKELVSRAKAHYTEQNETKLEKFYDDLLKGNSTELLSREFVEDDYFLLLKKLMQDDENEKVSHYVNLMKGVISSEIDADYKRHYILALNEINHFDIQIMKRIYIYSHYEMDFSGNRNEQLKRISNSSKTLTKSSLGNLFRLGFVEEEDGLYHPTEMLNEFLNLICSPEELVPAAINEHSVECVDIFISNFISNETEIKKFYSMMEPNQREVDKKIEHYKKVIASLCGVLEEKGLTYVSSSPENYHKLQENVRLHILCVDHSPNHMNMAYWHRNVINNDNVIKILMSSSTDGSPYDSVKHFGGTVIDFSSEHFINSVDELKKAITNKIIREP